jgi:hypothetical protein
MTEIPLVLVIVVPAALIIAAFTAGHRFALMGLDRAEYDKLLAAYNAEQRRIAEHECGAVLPPERPLQPSQRGYKV